MNTQDKARFFGHNLGAHVEYLNFNSDKMSIGIIEAVTLDGYIIIQEQARFHPIKNARLLLTPLDRITDEDEIEVSNIIASFDATNFIKGIQVQQRYTKQVSSTSNAVDYLRGKGYALPWNGYSVKEMQEAGWLKLKEV